MSDTPRLDVRFVPAAFADLPGWDGDDHRQALAAFLKSCGAVFERAAKGEGGHSAATPPALVSACRAAERSPELASTEAGARTFFEDHFTPHRVIHDGPGGLLTGYYEPSIAGSRTRGGPFQIPVFRRPPDLVNLVPESERGAMGHALTHARKTATGLEPYATRGEIEQGALDGQGLELVWLEDPVDAFFMHIQGSGRIELADGATMRLTYDGKNGHPYTSIGRFLIDNGLFPADRMSLDSLKAWLKEDAERGRKTMWQNASFVFFRELEGAEAESPLGVDAIPLTPGRSLAVDTRFHAIGTPVYVVAPQLAHATPPGGFRRLMIAQDVGSAIRGPERGDIYFGSGDEAGRRAGITKHAGSFLVLLGRDGGDRR